MTHKIIPTLATIRVYHGYGHKDNLVIYGHALAGKAAKPSRFTGNIFINIIHLVKLFFIKPISNAKVQLHWHDQIILSTTALDGFFKFEWKSNTSIMAGWHTVKVNLVDHDGNVCTMGEGKIFVPHATQYGFISDIDDTVLVSHSSKTGKKLFVLFTKNPRGRKTFSDVVKFYQLLSLAHTNASLLNPFFYVSSSEWNLYEHLNEFFKFNELPKGVFLLNEIKKWYQLFKTGKTKHQGKLIRVARIMEAFPKQRFILLGDNSQKDPEIYAAIANKYPEKIVAIYLRNIRSGNELDTLNLLEGIQNKKIHTCLFRHTKEAIQHARAIELVEMTDSELLQNFQ